MLLIFDRIQLSELPKILVLTNMVTSKSKKVGVTQRILMLEFQSSAFELLSKRDQNETLSRQMFQTFKSNFGHDCGYKAGQKKGQSLFFVCRCSTIHTCHSALESHLSGLESSL